jgi:hypothetical protein
LHETADMPHIPTGSQHPNHIGFMNETILHGWQPAPNNIRSTFDIFKTCIGTVFLLCWSSVCPNVPSLERGFLSKLAGKFQLFLLAVLGPEFIFITAMGQLNAAWRAKKAIQQAEGHADWTLQHCFFVNMGGVHLEFRDRKRQDLKTTTFPVDCEQLLYLVQHGYMAALPAISEDDISDRNKTDELGRAVAFLQTLWFTINIFGRISQGLYITTIELTTMAFVFLMTCCSICWWRKPMDISRPMVLSVEEDLSDVLSSIGLDSSSRGFGRTPLSFLNRQEWYPSRFWFYYIQILRKIKFLPSQTHKQTEADHFQSVEFPVPDLKWELAVCWMVPSYCAIFMAGWNFTYPTPIERTLWRISAIACLAFGIVGTMLVGLTQYHSNIANHWQVAVTWATRSNNRGTANSRDDTVPNPSKLVKFFQKCNQLFENIRNLAPDEDPMMAVSVRLLVPATTLAMVYSLTRLYILVEDVIGLRSLPKSAFETVNWGQYSPIL